MSVGIICPIGADYLSDFAISRAFRVTEDKNTGSCSCKVCGDKLEKGKGRAASVAAEQVAWSGCVNSSVRWP